MTDQTVHVLRAMAWERAKGELQSILQTFYDEQEKFDGAERCIEMFVAEMEGEGYAE